MPVLPHRISRTWRRTGVVETVGEAWAALRERVTPAPSLRTVFRLIATRKVCRPPCAVDYLVEDYLAYARRRLVRLQRQARRARKARWPQKPRPKRTRPKMTPAERAARREAFAEARRERWRAILNAPSAPPAVAPGPTPAVSPEHPTPTAATRHAGVAQQRPGRALNG